MARANKLLTTNYDDILLKIRDTELKASERQKEASFSVSGVVHKATVYVQDRGLGGYGYRFKGVEKESNADVYTTGWYGDVNTVLHSYRELQLKEYNKLK